MHLFEFFTSQHQLPYDAEEISESNHRSPAFPSIERITGKFAESLPGSLQRTALGAAPSTTENSAGFPLTYSAAQAFLRSFLIEHRPQRDGAVTHALENFCEFNSSKTMLSSATVSEFAALSKDGLTGIRSFDITATDLPFLQAEPLNSTTDLLNWNNTTLSSTEHSAEEQSLTRAIITGVILGVICLMTIGGNILVLLAVFVNSHLRGTTHYFIANLALADLLLGTTVLPFSAILEVLNFWAFGQLFCDIWAAIDVLCCTASILSLCVISIDRYIGVTRPLQRSTIITEKRAGCIILLVWLLSVTISIAPLLGWKGPPPKDPKICEVNTELGYVLFSVAGSFYIPLAIILLVYYRVYREAITQSRFLATGVKTTKSDSKGITLRVHTGKASRATSSASNITHPHKAIVGQSGGRKSLPCDSGVSINSQSDSRNQTNYQSSSSSEHSQESGRKNARLNLAGRMAKFKREKKAAKTLGIVVGVFIMCWFPFFFILPLGTLCKKCHIPESMFKVFFWLGYCNSMMNPIIYAMSSREFKRAFIRIMKCQLRRQSRSFSLSTSARSQSTMPGVYSTIRAITQRMGSNKPSTRQLLHVPGRMKRRTSPIVLLRGVASNRLSGQNSANADSPIHSLRLLQESSANIRRTGGVVISDDESAIIEHTDDERSDQESESVIVSFPRSPQATSDMRDANIIQDAHDEDIHADCDIILLHQRGENSTRTGDIQPCNVYHDGI